MNKEQLAARLLATFVAELEEQVGAINADLLSLEADPTNAERVKSLFRAAHTLKGAAGAARVPLVEEVCHGLETLLADARSGMITIGPAHFELLYPAADALADAATRLKAGRGLDESPLAVLRDRLQAPAALSRPPAQAPAASASLAPERQRGDGQVRVDGEKLDALLAATGQLLVTGSRVRSRPAELESLHDLAARRAVEWGRTSRRLRIALERSTAPASLLEGVQAMAEDLQRLSRDTARLAASVSADARALGLATDDVADRVRRLRMRPFAEACEALPRVLRDLAAATGKAVELEVVGGDVQVDRAVLDGLREAVLHLVRNAVDHGIEPPEVRAQAGKPRTGRVTVGAALAGERVRVTVADDGAGLDTTAIRAQLERRGLPVPADERDMVRALFQGGMSTRTEVTAISGRGVGLDIARAAVEGIRGSVDVQWTRGGGTTFTLECPPTLATIHVLLVTVGSQLIAVPTTHIERLLRVRPEELKRVEGRDVITTPEAPAPLVALARLLPPLTERPVAGPVPVVLLCAGDRRLAVVVDELVAEQELVLRPLGRSGKPLPHLSGAALLGSGRVALVVNPLAILAAGLGLTAGPGLAVAVATPEGATRRRVLVVDDSITTRTLEQSILEAAGYDVVTAVDGADGWKALQERGCDLVVADVEMPRMDGFALCEAIRGSKRFTALPVVLVTALETPEHRARGLEAGADAYIGKSSFDQQNLLDTVRQLIGPTNP